MNKCSQKLLSWKQVSSDLNKLTYHKLRTYCISLLSKEQKVYFGKLNGKDISNNSKFWHTVKLFVSDKVKSKEIINLVTSENVETNAKEVAKHLNYFFSLSSLPNLQAKRKYINQPIINIMRRFSQHFSSFCFSQVNKNTALMKRKILSAKKTIQETDIPVKVLKEDAKFFAKWIQLNDAHFFFNLTSETPLFYSFCYLH